MAVIEKHFEDTNKRSKACMFGLDPKQARKPQSYATPKLRPTHWRGGSVELLA